jgi:tetratricopeptide (TPR) repeat protein
MTCYAYLRFNEVNRMRSPITLIALLLLTSTNIRSFAQHQEVNPQTLPMQISAQETIAKTATGDKGWQVWLKLAVLLQDAARYRESEDAYLRTIDLVKSEDPTTVADVLDHTATMYVESGQLTKAEPMERRALATREEEHDQIGAGVSHMHLAMLLLGEGVLRPAETEAESAVRLLVPEYSSSSVNSAATPEEKMTALIDLSLVRSTSGAWATAVPSLSCALKIAHANYPDNSIPVGYIDFLLGYADWKTGESQSGDELMRRGLHELATQVGWGHPVYLRTLRQYGAYLNQTGQKAEARRIASEVKELDHSADSAVAHAGNVAVARESLR